MNKKLLNQAIEAVVPLANLSIAVAGSEIKKAQTGAKELNSILQAELPKLDATAREAVCIDLFHGVLRAYEKSTMTLKQFLEIFTLLYQEVSFYELDLLLEIKRSFTEYTQDFRKANILDELHDISKELDPNSLLCYLMRREILNLFLRSELFLEKQESVKELSAYLSATAESIKAEAESLSGDIFFYKERSGQND